MPANRVRDIFIARIKQLMSQYEESKAIKHGPTVGAMREQYLKSFLREMLPPKFAPVSGFIADMFGHITPQLDMIFIDRSELPTVSLVNDTVIVPREIALVTVEVKSRIEKPRPKNNRPGTFAQIKKQREAINGMPLAYLSQKTPSPRSRLQMSATVILAFESEYNDDELTRWMKEKEVDGLIGICVINRISIFPIYDPSPDKKPGDPLFKLHVLKPESSEGYEDYDPLLTFIAALYRLLYRG